MKALVLEYSPTILGSAKWGRQETEIYRYPSNCVMSVAQYHVRWRPWCYDFKSRDTCSGVPIPSFISFGKSPDFGAPAPATLCTCKTHSWTPTWAQWCPLSGAFPDDPLLDWNHPKTYFPAWFFDIFLQGRHVLSCNPKCSTLHCKK